MNNLINLSFLSILFLCSGCGDSSEEQKIEYHKNGNVKGIGKIKQSKKIGVWAYYDEDTAEVDSIPYKNGVKEGEARAYDLRTNTLSKKGSYKDDLQEGIWETYHFDGAVHSRATFTNGNAIGELLYFFADGTPKMSTPIKNGNLHGTYKEYHANGKLSIIGYYQNGERDGEWKEYNEEGVVKEMYQYQSGLWHGNYEKYHFNGNIKEKGRYELDQKSGTWEYFDENGVMISTENF
ncbi:toxin-antitoxin system YwqK family antitoxin [Aquimarina algiphila]|uniref:toxin-antitoxin system YwqK family antitoxin n=1 Tax=Aquimarina algiphila TaxID=2047982 RepID=UPI0024921722|nr:toxin-antitoxin system YwqK family antitoxin [Aquimarina algiphila]